VPANAGKAAGTVASNAQDVAAIAATLRSPPVLVGHSFGALILQQCLANAHAGVDGLTQVPGAALFGSPPPQGTNFVRYVFNSPVMAYKVHHILDSDVLSRCSCENEKKEKNKICYMPATDGTFGTDSVKEVCGADVANVSGSIELQAACMQCCTNHVVMRDQAAGGLLAERIKAEDRGAARAITPC
jgi:hypothetical protein